MLSKRDVRGFVAGPGVDAA